MSPQQPGWYQEAIIYELHIRAFFDSNHDGSGDFRGLVQKLDYLQNLGITAIWLLPFYPSPLKDDGYDIADYTDVHPAYGSLADFKLFLREAHRRNIRVITELVLNHTSDQHPWFQRARTNPPGSAWRDFYIWNDDDRKYPQARIIFQDFETSNWAWDPVAQAYYWHRFYSHQPDLNYDNPAVHQAVFDWVDFWLAMGVDGLRLDAVPYLFKREDTNCENLPETHQFLKKLRKYIDDKFPGRMLLAEANQWPEDAIAYFGNADECNMAFHFPLMPRMYMALQMQDRLPLVDIMQQTPAIPASCQWSIFLRNHDELTLEMVTAAERELMYRAYAQNPQARINLGIRRRLAPLLNNNRKKIELMNALLFSFPGTPVIYYGDEIGMGDNIYLHDRNSVRTPMQWSADSNAGFSQTHPQRLFLPVNIDPEYHYESNNVAAQQNNPESLWWWMKKMIALRKRYLALSLGRLQFLHPENHKILAYITEYQDQKILVIANLADHAEHTELDLSQWQGLRLIELFGSTDFPLITVKPYHFTLGPYNFYWFLLAVPLATVTSQNQSLPILNVDGAWQNIFQSNQVHKLENILPQYLNKQRWWNQKSRKTAAMKIAEVIPIPSPDKEIYLLFIESANSLDSENYILPVTTIASTKNSSFHKKFPNAVIAQLPAKQGYLVDALCDADLPKLWLDAIIRNRQFKGIHGTVYGRRAQNGKTLKFNNAIQPKILATEQSHNAIVFGKQLFLKCYRHLPTGINPELEMAQYLNKTEFSQHVPTLVGDLEYKNQQGQFISLGLLQTYCPHQATAWEVSLEQIQQFFKDSSKATAIRKTMPTSAHYFAAAAIPAEVDRLLAEYGMFAQLIGNRTAEMHNNLASSQQVNFAPQAFTQSYQRNLYQSIRSQLAQTLRQLQRAMQNLPEEIQQICRQVIKSVTHIENCLQPLLSCTYHGWRIRIHGDYHLGQLLYTGKDLVIVDFEGEPERSLTERRSLRSPLTDVAGMLRSFDYAAQTATLNQPQLAQAALFWQRWASVYFWQSYRQTIQPALITTDESELLALTKILLIEKALYEIRYELNNRPDYLIIPCQGLLNILLNI